MYCYSFLQVLMPTKVYNGQKLITLVKRKTAPITNKIIPSVPVTGSVFVK